MNRTTITVEQARGLILASAKNDVRYYLQGALIDFEAGRAVSTDGHCLLAINIETSVVDPAYGSAIVPRDALEQISKAGSKFDTVEIAYGPDGVTLARSSGLQITVPAINGRFPDYRRVIPESISGEPAQFDPDLMARICKALRLAVDAGPKACTYVEYNGTSSALVSVKGCSEQAIAVCMPWRAESDGNSAISIFFASKESKAA